jgi:hypothetical protein
MLFSAIFCGSIFPKTRIVKAARRGSQNKNACRHSFVEEFDEVSGVEQISRQARRPYALIMAIPSRSIPHALRQDGTRFFSAFRRLPLNLSCTAKSMSLGSPHSQIE